MSYQVSGSHSIWHEDVGTVSTIVNSIGRGQPVRPVNATKLELPLFILSFMHSFKGSPIDGCVSVGSSSRGHAIEGFQIPRRDLKLRGGT